MVYYMYLKLRITRQPCHESYLWPEPLNPSRLVTELRKRFIWNTEQPDGTGCATWGVENYNSKGEPTATHLHFHCYFSEGMVSDRGKELTELCVESHRKWITQEFNIKGNKQYSMKLLGDVRDLTAFFQYPVKQKLSYPNETAIGVIDQTGELNLSELKQRGNGDYERTKSPKVLALERQTNKNMFWDKLVVSVNEKTPTTNKQIWIAIANYYVEQGKTPPWASLDDKVLHYKVQVGLMSLEDAFGAYHAED